MFWVETLRLLVRAIAEINVSLFMVWCGDSGIAPGVSSLVVGYPSILNDTRTFWINFFFSNHIFGLFFGRRTLRSIFPKQEYGPREEYWLLNDLK
jgi:hypothetical protein